MEVFRYRAPKQLSADSKSLDLPEQVDRPRLCRKSGAIPGAVLGLTGLRADAGGVFSAPNPDASWRLKAIAGVRWPAANCQRAGAGRRFYFSSSRPLKKGRGRGFERAPGR